MNTDLVTHPAGRSPAAGTTHGPAPGEPAATAKPVALRLTLAKELPREKMSLGQLMAAQRDRQAGIELEAEVRRLAQQEGLDAAAARQLARQAAAGFRFVNGEPFPVAADRQTVLLGADGVSVLTVADWVARQVRQLRSTPREADGRFAPGADEEVLPVANPYRRKTWNLTAQMRLQRRDPRLARRLKAEAYADGESKRF